MDKDLKKEVEVVRSNDLSKMVANEHGVRILRWIIYELGGLEEPSFSTDSHLMAMAEGRRRVARDLSNELRRIDANFGSDLYRRVFEARYTRALVEKEK